MALASCIHDTQSPEGGGAAETGEKMPDQPGSRRLAVRARDADQPHPGSRIAFPQHGEVGERDASVGNYELWPVQVGGALHDRGRHPRPSCITDEGVAVGPESGDRHEEISRAGEARVRGEPIEGGRQLPLPTGRHPAQANSLLDRLTCDHCAYPPSTIGRRPVDPISGRIAGRPLFS